MALREIVVSIIDNADGGDPLWVFDAADAVIGAIRTHMTSPEAVERAFTAADAVYLRPSGWTHEEMLCAQILAALGEEL